METHLVGIPAPLWLILFLKVLGFVLHMVPMGLWAVGLPLAVVGACCTGTENPLRRFSLRLLRQMPILIALGINFGIVPLLFIQTLYPKPFYTATVLVAWHWIIVIPLLLIGYYGVYLVAFAAKERAANPAKGRMILPLGLLAALCFLLIGALMTNGFTLVAHPQFLTPIFDKTQIAGAVSGFGNNMGDPSFAWRLLTMLSLALTTVGVWALIDAFLLAEGARGDNTPYRRWAIRFATIHTGIAAILLSLVEAVVKSGRLDPLALDYPCFGFVPLLTFGLLALLAVTWKNGDYGGKMLTVIILVYTVSLALFGILRQVGQHRQITSVAALADLSEKTQWSPIAMFLATFVLGTLCIAWMVRQLTIAPPEPVQPESAAGG